ncbi:MAG: acyl-CoA dehydrogenase family protein, partial [Herbaspirillum sp.]
MQAPLFNASLVAPGPRNYVDSQLAGWLSTHAEALNNDASLSEELVPRLAGSGLFAIGVPVSQGGAGGDVRDAALAIAEVAEYSLSASFAFWGQRSFIEYLLQSPNQELAQRWLPRLIGGEHAGASGLSNAMKFLGGIESLQVAAQPVNEGWHLNGKLPWVTNLRKAGFVVAAAVARESGKAPMVVAFDSSRFHVAVVLGQRLLGVHHA